METGLVVGAGRPAASERLLPDHGSCRFVVDVEITGTVLEFCQREADRRSIGGEDRAGQGVGRRPVTVFQGFGVFFIFIDIDGQNRAEDFFNHGPVIGHFGKDNRRFDKEADTVVAFAADEYLGVGTLPRFGDEFADGVEGRAFDHRAHEVAEIGGRSHAYFGDFRPQPFTDRSPETSGDIGAAGRGTFLPLVFEGAANQSGDQLIDACTRMGEDEVLAACFPDDTGVGLVAGDVFADGSPHPLKHGCGAGEVNACEVGIGQADIADGGPRPGHEIDDAGRQPRFFEDFHEEVWCVDTAAGGLPDHGVAHDRRRSGADYPRWR